MDKQIQQTIGEKSRLGENIRFREETIRSNEREIDSINAELIKIDVSRKKFVPTFKCVNNLKNCFHPLQTCRT